MGRGIEDRNHYHHEIRICGKNHKSRWLFILLVPTIPREEKMSELNIEVKILRELRSKQSLNELNPGQRRELRIFCETWEDILAHLSSISDFSRAKEKIAQMALKKYGTFK